MLRSYSVIVPVLNKHGEIVRTLQSITDSMAFFDAHYPGAEEIRGEIVVVDEGSTDGTLGLIVRFGRDNPRLKLVRHHRAVGIGAARNTGVRVSEGEILFFCDGDDLYFPEHLFLGFTLLERSAGGTGNGPGSALLHVGARGHVVFPVSQPLAAVRTGVHLKDTVHPYWKAAIGQTLAQNLCVRRECHEWGEGFPDEAVYKRIGGCEDVAYNHWLNAFFRVGLVDMETVEYVRYPGNSLDQQMERFQHPPGSVFDVATPAQEALHEIRVQLEDHKIAYLLDKWRILGPPSLPGRLLNWAGVAGALASRGRWAEAVCVAHDAARQGQSLPLELLEKISASRGRAP